jgi:hypothetical protein
MKTLYFDIDGTVLGAETGRVKSALAEGTLERTIRRCGFERLVCVGGAVKSVRLLEELGQTPDGLAAVFMLCDGAFQDEVWFREHVSLVRDPDRRAEQIDLAGDWWYADDMAAFYFRAVGQEADYTEHLGKRIFVPAPEGRGCDLLAWLRASRG